MFDAPTRFEQQEARLRTFATANETVEASIIACLRALYHRNGWEDLGADDVRSLVGGDPGRRPGAVAAGTGA